MSRQIPTRSGAGLQRNFGAPSAPQAPPRTTEHTRPSSSPMASGDGSLAGSPFTGICVSMRSRCWALGLIGRRMQTAVYLLGVDQQAPRLSASDPQPETMPALKAFGDDFALSQLIALAASLTLQPGCTLPCASIGRSTISARP